MDQNVTEIIDFLESDDLGRQHLHHHHTHHRHHGQRYDDVNCTRSSLEEFPDLSFVLVDFGYPWSVLLPLIVVAYCVVALARLCHDRFVPTIKIICFNMGMSSDVAGATLMASAVSSPDLFINIVATFLTKGDIGLGTVLGCGVINTIAVPALCLLFTSAQTIRINRWPLTRDALFYLTALTTLAITLYDGIVLWYEAATMVALYVIYILVMLWNAELRNKFDYACWKISSANVKGDRQPLMAKPTYTRVMSRPYGMEEILEAENTGGWRSLLVPWRRKDYDKYSGIVIGDTDYTAGCGCRRWKFSDYAMFVWQVICWPIDLAIVMTVPPPSTTLSLLCGYGAITFVVCLGWVAVLSYIVAWMITLAGFTLGVPDSLMGLTFLAIGMSVPESITSIIVAKQGHGSMAISNAFGSNIFDTLLCLGLPWLLSTTLSPLIFDSTSGDPMSSAVQGVAINSSGLYTTTAMVVIATIALYSAIALSSFTITRTISALCVFGYVIFCIVVALNELNILRIGNLPTCSIGR